MPFLSIVIPVYNESENVIPLFEKIQAVCETLGSTYEIIFVDDGSKDDTFKKLSQLYKSALHLQVIQFRSNAGQTAAMTAGFQFAQGQRIISMDGDQQNDPVDIPKLLEKLNDGYDLVCGWRKERQDTFWKRRAPSIVANWIIGKVMGIPIHDNGCSLKAYRAGIIKQVPLYGEMHRFIPAMSQVVGARVGEIVVTHHPRRFGESKYGLGRIWRVMLDIIAFKLIIVAFVPCRNTEKRSWFRQILQERNFQQPPTELGMLARFFIFRCKQRPLRFFGPLGVLLVLLGSFLMVVPLLKVDFVIGLIWACITGGFFIFGFGLLGELISFANAKRVKTYTVETVLNAQNR